jgi:hypothetical protein
MAHSPILDPYADRPADASRPSEKKTSSLAILSLTASVTSFVCFPALGGLLGVVLGIAAKSEIARDDRSGSGMATGGIALGGVNLILSTAGLAMLLMWLPTGFSSRSSTPKPPATVMPAPPRVAPPTVPFAPPSPTTKSPPAHAGASKDESVTVTAVGNIDLVDLTRDAGPLTELLDTQRKEAKRKQQKLVLWLVVPDCKPCNGVAASLSDTRMQGALGATRLVRADVREFVGELSYLGLPTDKIPGFALLTDANRPTDYVHGGEWDEDVAENIAPVLSKFVRGAYVKRRHPWRGARRDDETAL